jgi:hypothetical protein
MGLDTGFQRSKREGGAYVGAIIPTETWFQFWNKPLAGIRPQLLVSHKSHKFLEATKKHKNALGKIIYAFVFFVPKTLSCLMCLLVAKTRCQPKIAALRSLNVFDRFCPTVGKRSGTTARGVSIAERCGAEYRQCLEVYERPGPENGGPSPQSR